LTIYIFWIYTVIKDYIEVIKIKRVLALVLIFLISVTAVPKADEAANGFSNGEVLVLYKNGEIEKLCFENQDKLSLAISELECREDVMLVQPNFEYKLNGYITNDALIAQQWALDNDGTFYIENRKNTYPVFDDPFEDLYNWWDDYFDDYYGFGRDGYQKYSMKAKSGVDINITDAWKKYKSGGKEVVVAIVDTGIDISHSEINGRTWINKKEIASNGIDDDRNGYTDDVNGWNFCNNTPWIFRGSEDDHGTHNAGTIVARTNGEGISGMVQKGNVKVMCVKALGGKDGTGSTESIVRAIKYAEENGASICNLSLGTQRDDRALYSAIANSDMLFVIAAGNEGKNSDVSPMYPAAYELDNIISVANLAYDGNLGDGSNYGKNSVDIAAPGTHIISTVSSNGYSYMSGSSMAAPFVSGAAAMVYSYFGDYIKLSDVKEILLSSVSKTSSLKDKVSTGGMLDVGAALSFNLDNLSGKPWRKPGDYPGSAPEISASQIPYSMKVRISADDPDGDLKRILYAYGSKGRSYFGVGNIEGEIKINSEGVYYFDAPSSGTYTFCAVDKQGNKSVVSANVSKYNYGYNNTYSHISDMDRLIRDIIRGQR